MRGFDLVPSAGHSPIQWWSCNRSALSLGAFPEVRHEEEDILGRMSVQIAQRPCFAD